MSNTGVLVDSAEILAETVGTLGHIRLNRPKAINSLTLEMVRAISGALDRFLADPAIASVLLTGEGERGLCAGGDIRALYDSGRAGTDLARTFWREEYILNARIKAYPKPYIAIMDGITMGGGVGVSAHGAHRIVTERTRLAMPETGIGFFPDVGGTWLLAHAPGDVGTYLGLTGEQIDGADAIYAGLADLFVPTLSVPALIDILKAIPRGSSNAEVRACLAGLAQPANAAALQAHRLDIDALFAFDNLEAILEALTRSTTEFAAKTRAKLLTKSPTSLKLTLRLLRLGRGSRSLEECLEREFAAGRQVLVGHDFYEGVRAAVIDKDRNPRWSPSRLEDVTEADIAAYVSPEAVPVFPDLQKV